MTTSSALNGLTATLSYIGCWCKNDMYSHTCSKMVDSLRQCGMQVDVITFNCRCFSLAQRFAITEDELINTKCSAIALPHAARFPGKGQGTLNYLTVKILRLDLAYLGVSCGKRQSLNWIGKKSPRSFLDLFSNQRGGGNSSEIGRA